MLDILTNLASETLTLLLPLIASLLAGLLIQWLRRQQLDLTAEQEAKIQAKVLQLVLSVEERLRVDRKLRVVPAGAEKVVSMAAILVDDVAKLDPDLARLPRAALNARIDATLTRLRAQTVAPLARVGSRNGTRVAKTSRTSQPVTPV